jgi:putative ABC transport system permease protein
MGEAGAGDRAGVEAGVTSRRRSLDGLDDDVRDHIERETQENIDRGMAPDEARDAALRAFGNVTLTMEETRAVWIPVWLDQLAQDARYGLRMLRRNPAFSLVVIVTLALGIGLNTAVFSVFNAVLLRPLAYPSPERLVSVSNYGAGLVSGMEAVGLTDFQMWREQATTSFDKLAAYQSSEQAVVTADSADQARLAWVSDDFWDLTAARPAVGRLPQPGERDVLVLSHAYFERRFQGDPRIVGSSAVVQGRQLLIAGVLPAAFRFQFPEPVQPQLGPAPIDGYRSMTLSRVPRPASNLVNVVGRLRPGATPETALAELDAVRSRIAKAEPFPIADDLKLRVVALQDRLVGQARPALRVLLAAVIFVLLIASVNIANLLLARASSRQNEIAIRASLGAGRGRLLRQFVVEGTILAIAGGAAGVLVARAGLAALVRSFPLAVPRLTEASIDGRALAVAISASMVTAVLFGLAPAFALRGSNVHDLLKDGARASSGPGRLRLRRALVAIELALAAVLLCSAGLMIRSIWLLHAHAGGESPEQTLVMQVRFSGSRYPAQPARRAYADEALRRIQALPGVRAASLTTDRDFLTHAVVEGAPRMSKDEMMRALPEALVATSAAFAPAMGLRMIAGRWITDREATPAVVINETAARRQFPGHNPIGRRLGLPLFPQPPFPQPAEPVLATVVGVVGDLKYSKLDATPDAELYVPYASAPLLVAFSFVVRVDGDPLTLAPAIRKAIAEIDRTQPIFGVMTLEQALADSIAPRRFNMLLLGVFAASALLLALIGIYGVIAYAVAQRTHEIGVRMALGAQRREVMRMVVRQGMAIASAGILLGIAAALALTRVLASLLYEVTPTDPATFVAVAGLLAITALAACGGPALKAALVDPIVALRCE